MPSDCYYLDGSLASDQKPCFPAQDFSPCCKVGDNTDVCTSTGLCINQGVKGDGGIWQGACTDPSYMSANCSRVCPGPYDNWDGSKEGTLYWRVFGCSNDQYYCRTAQDTESNCGSNVTARRTGQLGTILLSTSPVSTGGSATTSASNGSKMWIAAAVLGPFALVMTLALLYLLWCQSKQKRKHRILAEELLRQEKPQFSDGEIPRKETTDVLTEEFETGSHREELEAKIVMLEHKIATLETTTTAHELGSHHEPVEMEGGGISPAEGPEAIGQSGFRKV